MVCLSKSGLDDVDSKLFKQNARKHGKENYGLLNECTPLLALRYGFTLLLMLNRGNSFVSMRGSGVCNHTSGLPISYFPINYYLLPDVVIMSSSAV